MKMLINKKYLREYSLFPENYDLAEIMNFIPISENIHIKPILGTALYDELLKRVENNNLDEKYSELLVEVYKVEGIAVFSESLPFIWASISKVGITKGNSNNSDSVEAEDLRFLSAHVKSQLNYSKVALKDFLNKHQDLFPLYTSNETEFKKHLDKNVYHMLKDNIDIE